MKTINRIAATMLASVCVAAAAISAPNGAGPQDAGFRGMPGEFGGGFTAALRQLNLTDQQKQSIKDLMSNARQQAQSQAGNADLAALNNPGDPNYAQAVRNAQALATNRIQQRSNLDQQIYNLLTPEQKAQLPQVLADMKAKAQQRRAARLQKSGSVAK